MIEDGLVLEVAHDTPLSGSPGTIRPTIAFVLLTSRCSWALFESHLASFVADVLECISDGRLLAADRHVTCTFTHRLLYKQTALAELTTRRWCWYRTAIRTKFGSSEAGAPPMAVLAIRSGKSRRRHPVLPDDHRCNAMSDHSSPLS
jgi:hypothetical protein